MYIIFTKNWHLGLMWHRPLPIISNDTFSIKVRQKSNGSHHLFPQTLLGFLIWEQTPEGNTFFINALYIRQCFNFKVFYCNEDGIYCCWIYLAERRRQQSLDWTLPRKTEEKKNFTKQTACRHQFSNNLQNTVICRLWYCCQKQSHSIGTILRCIHLHLWFNISPNIPLVQVWTIAWIGSNHLDTICYLSIVWRINMFLSILTSSKMEFSLAIHRGCPRRGCIAISSRIFTLNFLV